MLTEWFTGFVWLFVSVMKSDWAFVCFAPFSACTASFFPQWRKFLRIAGIKSNVHLTLHTLKSSCEILAVKISWFANCGFYPQVERARASLPSPCLLGSFCNLWFFLLGLTEQVVFCHLLVCLLESFCNFWYFLLRLREHQLVCHLLLIGSFCSLVIMISFARKLFVTDHACLLLKELS